LNIYETAGDTETLAEKGIEYDGMGYFLFVFDIVKLILYTLYFGKQNLNDILFLKNNPGNIGSGEIVALLWNMTVNYCNTLNFIYFIILSREYDVNQLLRDRKYVDSQQMSEMYQTAQQFDSLLVIMNVLMLIQFTTISRRVSVLFKLIGITIPYLIYIIMAYFGALFFMSMIVW